ncbi:alpha/beta hydrolase [Paenibacillus sp. GCM10028914]|uniref:alpha/beta hydrolase n=1 Tax=Paenibacillus sp. GCM10028914 TaxID=3273416 RepID=UPI003610557F
MSKYNIHSDFEELKNIKLPFYPIILPILNKLVQRKNNRMKLPDTIKVSNKRIESYQGGEISLTIYEPVHVGTENCIIYFHGGAFAIKEAPYHINLCVDYALKTPCKVIFVDYRLLPKHKFPYGLEDCYSACKWVVANADQLNINREKIAVVGDSAGGALAAGVSLLARDRGEINIKFQVLIYPVIDKKQNTNSMKLYYDTPMWNSKLNKKMWNLYLKGVSSGRYASPIDVESHMNLPASYIEVAEYDCLRDEGIQYAEALRKEKVPVQLNITKGTVHGYDIVESSSITELNKEIRIKALQDAFRD